jgi:hypothetical protein
VERDAELRKAEIGAQIVSFNLTNALICPSGQASIGLRAITIPGATAPVKFMGLKL